MATWITHLRIADALLDVFPDVEPRAFIVGNVAPDSGVAVSGKTAFSPDESKEALTGAFDPPKEISHWWSAVSESTERFIRHSDFYGEYLHGKVPDAFYLGYYAHLVADQLWAVNVYRPYKIRHASAFAHDREKILRAIKRDWYDLDFLFLRDNPGFRAFEILRGTEKFPNTYLPYFSETAVGDKVRYIAEFYASSGDRTLDREYAYLTRAGIDAFVADTVEFLRSDFTKMAYCNKLTVDKDKI